MLEYPKMLFKGADHLIVGDEVEEAEAKRAGWRNAGQHPLDHDGDGAKGGSLPKRRAK